ncbi:MAG: FKBP-type peptidyl-prolyl cis-trans isomerase [Balneolaceae bacterium]|nr:FKBP-type peptidyl-prolyl cis-trans isomerase [Balneolaceae bacterium]
MAIFLFTSCQSGTVGGTGDAELESQIDSVSYSIGYQIGSNIKTQGMGDVDLDVLMAAINDGLNDNDPVLSQSTMQNVVRGYQLIAQQKAQELRKQTGIDNLEEAQEFLKENRQKEGVTVTDSGLQYKVLKEGDGPSPSSTDTVVVHYRGMLADSTVFDSSYERGEPAEFALNGVIPGWTEGLQLMNEGGRFIFYIPPDLAYGENPPPRSVIGSNNVLIFEVELLEVK